MRCGWNCWGVSRMRWRVLHYLISLMLWRFGVMNPGGERWWTNFHAIWSICTWRPPATINIIKHLNLYWATVSFWTASCLFSLSFRKKVTTCAGSVGVPWRTWASTATTSGSCGAAWCQDGYAKMSRTTWVIWKSATCRAANSRKCFLYICFV